MAVTSGGPRNIHLVPIGYGCRPRLRGRLTLRGLTLRRNPWTFGDRVSHPVCRYSCHHSHWRSLHRMAHAPASSKALRFLLLALPLRYLSTMGLPTPLVRSTAAKSEEARHYITPRSATAHVSRRCTLSFGSRLEPRYIFAAGQLV